MLIFTSHEERMSEEYEVEDRWLTHLEERTSRREIQPKVTDKWRTHTHTQRIQDEKTTHLGRNQVAGSRINPGQIRAYLLGEICQNTVQNTIVFLYSMLLSKCLSRLPIMFSFRNMDCNQAFMHLGFMITYSTLSLYHFVYVLIINMIRVVFQVGSSYMVIC